MNIELRNVKFISSMSEETNCFTASVYIDGKREGEVGNDGRGGCHRYHPHTLESTLEAHAKTLPPEPNPYHPGQFMPITADDLINTAFEQHLNKKEFERLTKNRTCIRIPGQAYHTGQWATISRPYTPELKAQVLAKYGAATIILNDNPALITS